MGPKCKLFWQKKNKKKTTFICTFDWLSTVQFTKTYAYVLSV